MSTPFYDLASLVLVPSGYKASKVYAQKPLTTDGQLTFSRASTATRVNASGLIETVSSNVPRLDYLGSTCPKLQLEPSRTNLALASSDFANVYWEKGGAATITSNTVVSPDGTQNADTLTANGTGAIFARAVVYLATTQVCTNSVFVKKANHRYVGFRNSGSVSNHDVFDFDTKTWTNNSGATLSYDELGNGWFRLKSTNIDTVNGNYYWSVIPAVNTSGLETTTASNLSVYIWGAQAEQNAAYTTSYIPTTSAAVTRLADTYQKGGFGNTSTAGTFFCEFVATRITSDNGMYLYGMGVGTTDTLGSSYATNTGSLSIIANGPTLQGRNNGYGTNLFSLTPTAGATVKIAIRYDGTNVVAFVNGVKQTVYTDNAVGVKNFIRVNNGEQSSHATKQLLFFPTALTDAQAIELTTL